MRRSWLLGPEPWNAGRSRAASASIAGLHLFALVGFSIAQPLYDLVGRFAGFLVAHAAQAVDVAALVLVLSLALPAALLISELLAAVAGRRAARWWHRVLIGSLLAAFLLQAMKSEQLPGWLLVSLAAVFGASGAATYAGRGWLRCLLTLLAPMALLFPLYFLLATPVASLLSAGGAAPPVISEEGPSTPVVVVILDEFSTVSIMDASERIDGRRYPHLAALAAEAIWFRNATTVASDTTYALPAILNGRYPDRPRLATAAHHPRTLMTLLAPTHDLRVFECVTALCPPELCAGRPRRPVVEQVPAMLLDLSFVYLHLLLPADLTTRLPPVSATWRDFGGARRDGDDAFVASHRAGGPAHFDRFLDALRSGRDSTLYLVHLLLPHWPWEFLPSGKEYGPLAAQVRDWAMPTPTDPARGRGYYWGTDEWSVIQAHQRYLLQVGYLDRLIGELTDTLRQAGLYEESLLVIVADHGVSFLPGFSRKRFEDRGAAHFTDVANVPLIVKLPGQREGRISDRNVQTIDILPTIADALGLPVPWRVDGTSALAAGRAADPEKRAFNNARSGGPGEPFVFDLDRLGARRESLDRQLALFGSGNDAGSLFRIGPRPDLLGREVGDLLAAAGPERAVDFDSAPELIERYDPAGAFAPTHVTGRIIEAATGTGPLELAVAVNSIVRAVTQTFDRKEERGLFTAMVPESAFAPGSNRVELFAISTAGGAASLQPILRRSAESFALGELAGGRPALFHDGRPIPVVAGEVQGELNEVVQRTSSGWGTITGWAADVAAGAPATRVVVFADGRLAGSAVPDGARPDVARRFSEPGVLRSGFGIAVPPSLFPAQPPYPVVRIIATSERGVASEVASATPTK